MSDHPWWYVLVEWLRAQRRGCDGTPGRFDYVGGGRWRCARCGAVDPIAELLARHGVTAPKEAA